MIVQMRKVSMLLYHSESDGFLRSLQELGVVHIEEHAEKDRESLQEIEAQIKRCERILAWLDSTHKEPVPQLGDMEPEAVIEQFERLESERIILEQHLQSAQKEEALLAPWGEFDPSLIARLRSTGVVIRFYAAPPKKYEELCAQGFALTPVRMHRGNVLCMLIAYGAENAVDAEEVLLPERSLADVRRNIAEHRAALNRVEHRMLELGAYSELLHSYLSGLKNRYRLLSARLDLIPCVDGKVMAITGWCPAEKEKNVAAFLKRFSAWFEFTDPLPGDDVPVLLKNGPFARLFEPITRLFSLPDYRETDPTPFFAPFFSLYVGLCIGDVGYGLLIALASYIALRKIKNPKARPFCIMMMLFGGTTILGGMLLNTCFGKTLFGGPGVPEGTAFFEKGAQFFSPLSPIESERGLTYPMMNFALLLGFLQVMLALVLRSVNSIRQGGILFGLHPLSYLLCLCGGLVWAAHENLMNLDLASFTVGPARVGVLLLAVPETFGTIVFWTGIIMLFLFNNPDKRLPVRLPLGLWELYGFATGILGDILSYMRLFALGLSSGLLGASFNKLALMLVTKAGVVQYVSPLMVVSVLLLVFGHALNLLLSMVGAFVHPLRLTFVEFYKNLGFKGGGKPYEPLARME